MGTTDVGAADDQPLTDVLDKLELWQRAWLPKVLSPLIQTRAELIDWIALHPHERRSMAMQIDAQLDPANEAEEQAGFDAECRRQALEQERRQLATIAPRSVDEMVAQKRELERIDAELVQLADGRSGTSAALRSVASDAPAPAPAPEQRSKPLRFDPLRRELAAVVESLRKAGKPIDAHVVVEELKGRVRPEGPIFGSTTSSIKWYDSKGHDKEISFADVGRRLKDLLELQASVE